jgi:hypothetical protein
MPLKFMKNMTQSIADVLKVQNASKILSNMLKIEENAVIGVAAELAYIAALMASAFILAQLLIIFTKL